MMFERLYELIRGEKPFLFSVGDIVQHIAWEPECDDTNDISWPIGPKSPRFVIIQRERIEGAFGISVKYLVRGLYAQGTVGTTCFYVFETELRASEPYRPRCKQTAP